MAYEKSTTVKRTIWIWTCCDDRQEFTEKPPFKERQCPNCKAWSAPEEVNYVGPDTLSP